MGDKKDMLGILVEKGWPDEIIEKADVAEIEQAKERILYGDLYTEAGRNKLTD